MENGRYVAFISNGNKLKVSNEQDIVELELHDQVIQSDECTCTNKEHFSSCEIENVAVEVASGKNKRSSYVVEMAFCKECGAYYIPQKSYDYLEQHGTMTHEVKGGVRLFEYLNHGSSYNEEKQALGKIEKNLRKEYDNLPKPISRYAVDDGCGGLHDIQGQKYSAKKIYDMQDRINEMMSEPYVGRIDVSNTDGNHREACYIGKTEDKLIGKTRVYSRWSEEGRLFGRTTEEKGKIGGTNKQVHLRRRIDISNGKLRGIEDQFASNSEFADKGIYDKFLIQVLMSRKKSHQLTDIIATIQDKQNEIIEKAYAANIIVQGCAGSGKTMVMLHRLSFWLYNNKSLQPEKIKILTPNENFNVHIGGLHSQLNLGAIEIMSVDQYYEMILEKYDKRIAHKGKVAEEENVEERYLNYIYSKSFLKAINANYDEVITEYVLPEELDLLKECADKCGFKYTITSDMSDGDKVLEISRVAHEIKSKNGTSRYARDTYLNNIEKIEDNYIKSENKKLLAMEILQKLETNYKTELATVFARAREASAERTKELDNQIEAETNNLNTLKRSLLRIVNGNNIKKAEEAIEKLSKKKAEETKLENAIAGIIKIMAEADSLEIVLDEISKRKSAREDSFISEYVRDYRKASRTVAEQNQLMQSALEQKQEQEAKLADVQMLLTEDEHDFIEDLCKKYPITIALDIFKKCYELSISEKLRELEMEQPTKVYRCELYARVYFAEKFWNKIVGEDELICVDEGQDVSYYEYERIVAQNKNNHTFYNVYGDLNQRIKQGRGLVTWEQLKRLLLAHEFTLNENYRNTNQITQYCNDVFNFDMTLTGVEGAPVRNISFDEMISELVEVAGNADRTAVILPRAMSKQRVTRARKLENKRESLSVKFDTSKVSIMYVDEIKGIEFDRVYVVDQDMERNERYIAFTRALDNLSIVH